METRIIKPRDREAIIRALRSGVVPPSGLQHIQVGRSREIASFIRDIDTVAEGGASFRIVVGEYGSGKTFFLTLAANMALERNLVTMRADLSPELRFNGSQGQPRRLLQTLIASLATKTKRDGGALPVLLERLRARAGGDGETFRCLLDPVRSLPGGHDFARVVELYAEGDDNGRLDALRWLQADIATKTDALRCVGVRHFLGEGEFFAVLRLYATLARAAGFAGLYVCIDELVNLYKITNTTSRRANYEEILAMLNNTLQGDIHGLGIVFGATPETLTDTRRGLYSYEALRSRLAENSLGAQRGITDYDATALRLANLTKEELYLLLGNVRRVFASGDPEMEARVPDRAIEAYMARCFDKIGESYFRTPRNTIKGFVDLLSLLRQYPEKEWTDLLPDIAVEADREPSPLQDDLCTL